MASSSGKKDGEKVDRYDDCWKSIKVCWCGSGGEEARRVGLCGHVIQDRGKSESVEPPPPIKVHKDKTHGARISSSVVLLCNDSILSRG